MREKKFNYVIYRLLARTTWLSMFSNVLHVIAKMERTTKIWCVCAFKSAY